MKEYKVKFFGKDVYVEEGTEWDWAGRLIVLGKWVGLPPMVTGFIFSFLVVIIVQVIVFLIVGMSK